MRHICSLSAADEAYKLMFHNHVSRLPVLQAQENAPGAKCSYLVRAHTCTGKLVGVISERDLRLAADSPFLGEPVGKAVENLHKHKVSDVMAKAVVSVDEADTIVDAAKLLRVSHIDGAPVVSSAGEVIGMISRTGAADGSIGQSNNAADLLDHLIRVLEPLSDSSAKQSV